MKPGVTPNAATNVALSSPSSRLISSPNWPISGSEGCRMSPLPMSGFLTAGTRLAVLSRTRVVPMVPAESTTFSASIVTVVPGGTPRPQGSTMVLP
jgi:hypothetical protein